MTLVFDTCALLRLTLEFGRPFSEPWKEQLDPDSAFLCAVSIYEIVWKNRAGRLELGMAADDYIARVRQLPLTILPIDDRVAEHAARLDWTHKDPFDRLIVTIASHTQATLLTVDREIVAYFDSTAW